MINGMSATPLKIKDQVKKMMLVDASERTAVEAALAMWGPKESGGPFDAFQPLRAKNAVYDRLIEALHRLPPDQRRAIAEILDDTQPESRRRHTLICGDPNHLGGNQCES